MRKTKCTPGPWRLVDHRDEEFEGAVVVQSATGFMVADCNIFGPLPEKEQEHNARLIAAAPDLLAAIDALLDRHDRDDAVSDPLWDAARAAVAKARGTNAQA